jgi:hypothetical protein
MGGFGSAVATAQAAAPPAVLAPAAVDGGSGAPALHYRLGVREASWRTEAAPLAAAPAVVQSPQTATTVELIDSTGSTAVPTPLPVGPPTHPAPSSLVHVVIQALPAVAAPAVSVVANARPVAVLAIALSILSR